MSDAEVISLAISVGLGILSIGLALFAIWLSRGFNDRSTAALESVKELANDIRVKTEITLTHQQDFSGRLLDTVLDQYGRPLQQAKDQTPGAVEELIRERLEEVEKTIAGTIEESVRQLVHAADTDPQVTQETIDEIREEISRLSTTAQEISTEAVLPIAIRERLMSYQDIPAYYTLLAGIAKSGATSPSDLESAQEQYHFPAGYQSAVGNLVYKRLLAGDSQHFSLPEDSRDAILAWVDKNWTTLSELSKLYERDPANQNSEQETRQIVQKLEF